MIRKPFTSAVLATAIFGMLGPLVPVHAQVPLTISGNAVHSWNSVVDTDGATTLTIRFTKAFDGNMASFAGPDGDYIAFDFPSYSIGDAVNQAGTPQGLVKNVRFVETGKRLRAVVKIEKGSAYKTFVKDGALVVRLSNNQTADTGPTLVEIPTVTVASLPVETVSAIVPTSAAVPAALLNTTVQAPEKKSTPFLRDIEFKKTGADKGQLLLDLSDPNAKVKVYREGMNLAVELPNTALPRNLAKRLRVENMDTPVVAISPSLPREGQTKLTLEMRGGWDYTFAQHNNAMSVDIFKIGEDYKVGGKRVFTGKKMSLSFQQIDVRTVLQILAEFTGLNIIASDTVKGNITLRLNEVPWDQALDIILSSGDLDKRVNGDVIWIAPRAELNNREKSELADKKELLGFEPLVTETFQLNYQKAEAIKALFETNTSAIDGRENRGNVTIDVRSNKVFIRDTAERIEDFRRTIKEVDIPMRQVAIEAKIVEVSDTFARNVGVKFGLEGSTLNLGNGRGLLLGNSVGGNQSFINGNTTGAAPGLNVNLPGGGINGASPGSFAFTLFNSSLTKFLNLEVSALEADGKAKTISSPRVVTSDGKEAIISQGTEIPYLQASSSGAANVAFKPATMELKVIPQITPDGRVTLDLEVKKDSVGQNTTAGPAIDTKRVQTAVLIENGGTIVIGGIFSVNETNVQNKVPLLGDLPLFGKAFQNNSKETLKKEMVIMITPRIIEANDVQK